jgi:HlyD family secretion protein
MIKPTDKRCFFVAWTGPVSLFGLLLCFSACSQTGKDAGWHRVTAGDWQKVIVLTGSMQARKFEEFQVPATNARSLQIKWLVKEGDEVKPGDVVIRFDTANLASEIENNEEVLKNKQLELQQKEVDCSHQKLELETEQKSAENELRQKEIDASIPLELQSRYEYDRKQLEKKKSDFTLAGTLTKKSVKLIELQTQIQIVKIEIDKLKLKLKTLQTTLNNLNLKAVTGGAIVYGEMEVSQRKIQVGDTVFRSQTVATIPDRSSLYVQALICETQVRQIGVGQKVDLIPDAYPERHFPGRIVSIMDKAEPIIQWGKAHYFRVEIDPEKLDHTIMKPGMSVRCDVFGGHYARVLRIPLEAAFFDGVTFWLKPRSGAPVKIKILDFDEFTIAAKGEENRTLVAGMELEPPEGIRGNRESGRHENQ